MKRLYTKRIGFSKGFIIGILFVLLPMKGLCTTYTWNYNGIVGYWNDPSKWLPNTGYPNLAGDDAVLSSGSCVVVINVAISINSITMTGTFSGTVGQGAGSTITIAGVSTFDKGYFTGNDADITFNSGLTISGTSFQGTSANLNINGGSFTISSGSFASGGVGTVIITANGSNGISGTTIFTALFNNLIVQSGSTATFGFNSPFTVAGSLTLKTTTIRSLSISIPAGVTPVVNGTTSYSDTGNGGSILVNGLGSLQLNGNLDISGDGTGTIGGGTGTIKFGGINQSIIGIAGSFTRAMLPNVTINSTGTFTISGNVTVTGNWTISGTVTSFTANSLSKLVFYPQNATMTINSALATWALYDANVLGNGVSSVAKFTGYSPSVTDLFTLGTTTSVTTIDISSTNNLKVNAMRTQGSASYYTDVLTGILEITGYYTAGSYSLQIGNTAIAPNTNSGTILFSGNTSQLITNNPITGGITNTTGVLPNITIAQGASGTLDLGSNTIIPLSGNWTYTSGTVIANTATVSFYNSSAGATQTVTGSGMNFNNIFIQTPHLALGSNIFINGKIYDTSGGGFLDPTTNHYAITLQGDWDLLNTVYNTSNYAASVIITGNNNSQVIKLNGAGPFYNLTINKTASSNYVTLNTPITVLGALTLTRGNIVTGSNNVNLNIGATSSTVALGNGISYINGNVQWTINAPTPPQTLVCNFPIGGTDWSPIALTIHVINANQTIYKASMVNGSPITGFPGFTLGSGIQKISGVRYWALSQTHVTSVNSDRITLTAYFNTNDQVTDPTNLSLARATNSTSPWTDTGISSRNPTGGPIYTGNISTLTNIATISNGTDLFTFDDVGTGANPLPITLSSFKAAFDNTGTTVNVLWTTESEEAGTYFTLERADKSLSFEALTTVKPDGKNGREEYSYVDQHPLSGLSYYRLKQTSIKGEVTYNTIVSVNSTIERAAGVYPNPGDGKAMHLLIPSVLQHEDNVTLTICNQLDEVVTNETIVLDGKDEIELHMVSPLPAGIYYVSFGGGGIFYSMKYMVR